MAEEQNIQQKKKGGCKVLVIMVIVSLICSIASLTLSTLMATGNMPGGSTEGKKVVISKQYDKGKSMEKAQATGKPIIAFFYTDWCGFCQRFAPTFHKITKDKRIKENFAIAYVNCEQESNRATVEKYAIQGFPTVFVIKPNGEKTQLENNTFFNEDSKTVVANKALEIIGQSY